MPVPDYERPQIFGPGGQPSFYENLALEKKREKQLSWDTYWLGMAVYVSIKSKDTSTKNGCVIVDEEDRDQISVGYNGMPPGVNDDVEERYESPEKFFWFEHAERNAINFAAKRGKRTKGCTAYLTAKPCADCARGLIGSGIKRVVVPKNNHMKPREESERWGRSMEVALEMLREGGVTFVEVDVDVEVIGRKFHDYTKIYEEMSLGLREEMGK